MRLPFNLFLGIYFKETLVIYEKLLISSLLVAVPLIIVKDKNPRGPLIGNWLNKTMEYSAATKQNEKELYMFLWSAPQTELNKSKKKSHD